MSDSALTQRSDTLFELCDAILCEDGPVTSPVDLMLLAEHRRGHGALYDALNRGRIDVDRLRKALAMLPQPKAAEGRRRPPTGADGRLVLAVDVSAWLRPDAPTSPDHLFCHVYGRSGRSSDQVHPRLADSFVAALETGRTSWCQLLDVVRLGPDDDVAEVTGAQVRHVVTDLIDQGQWEAGDDDILVVFDAGYDTPRMAHLLGGIPIEVLGRMRSDRVMRRPAPSRKELSLASPQGGRYPKHGKEFRFAKPDTWGQPDSATVQVTDRYGTARAMAWDRIHPRLTARSARIDHDGELPISEGTLIRLQVNHLPGGGDPLPVWLWSSKTSMTSADVDLRWQAFLRRFDLEHTFRFTEQTLGWTRPKLRAPESADRWTWLVIAAHTQLRLTREAAADLRRPWGKPAAPPVHPGPRPPGVQEHPPLLALPGPCTQTFNSRTRPPTWLQESAARHPLWRGQIDQTPRVNR